MMSASFEGSARHSSSRSTMGPTKLTTTTREYHEYHSSSTYPEGGSYPRSVPNVVDGGHASNSINGGGAQLQNIVPPPSPSLSGLMQRSKQGRFLNANNGLQEQQQQHQEMSTSYSSSYKMQGGQSYSQGGSFSKGHQVHQPHNHASGPAGSSSHMKQNIDELDSLLSDLNEARKLEIQDGNFSGPIGPPRVQSGLHSDYQKKYTVVSSSSSSTVTTTGSRTVHNGHHNVSSIPASPATLRSRSQESPRAGPSSPRRGSPGPPSTTQARMHHHLSRDPSPPLVAPQHLIYTESYQSQGDFVNKTTASSLNDYHRSASPSLGPAGPPAGTAPGSRAFNRDGTPPGVAYYNKYHSSHSHQSQHHLSHSRSSSPAAAAAAAMAPASFSNRRAPTPNGQGHLSQQDLPKRVDDLMTELSEFDPSIQPTIGFTEPSSPKPRGGEKDLHLMATSSGENSYRARSPTAGLRSRPAKQPSTPGPAVYYPPGDIFGSKGAAKDDGDGGQQQGMTASKAGALEARGGGSGGGGHGKGHYKAKGQYGYKEKYSESDSKQGAAVIPICLPLCCAAPCVIM